MNTIEIINKTTEKRFVLESSSPKSRITDIKTNLNKGRLYNKELQRDWVTLGENNFEFKISLKNAQSLLNKHFPSVYNTRQIDKATANFEFPIVPRDYPESAVALRRLSYKEIKKEVESREGFKLLTTIKQYKKHYKNTSSKVQFICPVHGKQENYFTSFRNHEFGCKLCAEKARTPFWYSTEEINNLVKKRGYDIDPNFIWKGVKSKIGFICGLHGKQEVSANNFINCSSGCMACADIERGQKRRLSIKSFKKRLNKTLKEKGLKLEQPITKKIRVTDLLTLSCKHGKRRASLYTLESQKFCCVSGVSLSKKSKGQTQVVKFLRKHYKEEIKEENTNLLAPKRIDIVIPALKVAIEYNGDFWHDHQEEREENYHNNKFVNLKNLGYHLIYIWESDWMKKEQRIKVKRELKAVLKNEKSPQEYSLTAEDENYDFNLDLRVTFSALSRKREYQKLQEKEGDYKSIPRYNKNVLTFQQHFYKKERELWKDPAFKEKMLVNRTQYLFKHREQLTVNDILRGFRYNGYKGFSHFSPLWIKAFIEEFKVKSIYDPCAGWGHRLLGAASSGIVYIGNDTCRKTVKGLKKIVDDLNIKKVTLYSKDAAKFKPKEKYDAVFTCPPYFMTEYYENRRTSTTTHLRYSDWLSKWWKNTITNSLAGNPTYFAFVVSEKFLKDMQAIVPLPLLKSYRVGNKEILLIFKRKT